MSESASARQPDDQANDQHADHPDSQTQPQSGVAPEALHADAEAEGVSADAKPVELTAAQLHQRATVRERIATLASQAPGGTGERVFAPAGQASGGATPRQGTKGPRFDKFTERARKVLVLAQREAEGFNHNYIGTEHLLLGLVREAEGIGGRVLAITGIKLEVVRSSVEFIIGRGDRKVKGDISLTPRSKKVIELAIDEARSLNHSYVGTEHLLLGLIREGEGIAAGVLESLGVTLHELRQNVLSVLAETTQSAEPMPTKDNVISCRLNDADLAAIDMLIEAGIRGSRSEAAQWLIHAGITAHKELFAKVEGTVGEIRRLRDEARQAAWQVAGDTESLINTTSSEEPRPGGD